jgi:hypothetical protein
MNLMDKEYLLIEIQNLIEIKKLIENKKIQLEQKKNNYSKSCIIYTNKKQELSDIIKKDMQMIRVFNI